MVQYVFDRQQMHKLLLYVQKHQPSIPHSGIAKKAFHAAHPTISHETAYQLIDVLNRRGAKWPQVSVPIIRQESVEDGAVVITVCLVLYRIV